MTKHERIERALRRLVIAVKEHGEARWYDDDFEEDDGSNSIEITGARVVRAIEQAERALSPRRRKSSIDGPSPVEPSNQP